MRIYSNIPNELKALPQWVTYKGKIPYTPATGEKAKSGEPETWDTFTATLDDLQSGQYDDLGFEFHNNGIVGVDLDKAISEDGQPKAWALEIVDALNSYTEYSISGKGLHIFIYGDIPADGRKKKLSESGEAVGIYKARRYFAMTGNVYRAVSIADRHAEITAIYEKYFSSPEPKRATLQQPSPPPPSGKDYLSIGLERDSKNALLKVITMDKYQLYSLPIQSTVV
ncbi:primase-polymerase (primpol)-like protein [Lachnospiraceae bacterium PM6-15]|uniref:hypothetical protein n=1 Tax=Ohessyouella blattaphilus TaxID=2949333 RepID=UPI003E2ED98B